ncbi:hypothetical protein [Luteolibacter luteus]|uniref:Uncharacterized protein n=1 Tax=Luteolibacter luteus TaxID=2728835 RepID=A0A858RCQ0_9BACT|nr:hypothetical protein [Luteolibacter luteus]QJE94465.1 hypothetical protein HHL09_01230 [Luteolibacter luteus]
MEKIHPETPLPKASDKKALAEQRAIEDGNYEALDSHDNYNLRKCIKDGFVKKIPWVVGIVIGFALCLVIFLTFLIGDYVMMIVNNEKKVEEVLTHIFTHTLVLVLGASSRFLFPKKGG